MEQVTEEEIGQLREHYRERSENGPRIASAKFNEESGYLMVNIVSPFLPASLLTFDIRKVDGYGQATANEMHGFIVSADGHSIRWPEIEIGLTAEQLVTVAFGLKDDSLRRHLSNAGRMMTEKRVQANRERAKLPRAKRALDEFECTCGGCPDNPKTNCPRGRAILRRK